MKKTLLSSFLILFSFLCYSQDISELIVLEDYYKEVGVIFKENYKPPFQISNFKESFTPSKEQIIEVESILFEQYNLSKKEMVDNLNKKSEETLIYPKYVKNVKKKLCKYKRQYVGYYTTEGDIIISVNLLNFKNKKKAKEHFSYWKDEYIIGLDGFYYKNIEYFSVNLTTKKINRR